MMSRQHDNEALSSHTEMSPQQSQINGTNATQSPTKQLAADDPATVSTNNSTYMSNVRHSGGEMILPSVKDEDTVQEPCNASEAFSLILDSVGSDGRWQWYLLLLTVFGSNLMALHSMAAALLAAEPDHWCRVPELEDHLSNATDETDWRNVSIPWEVGSDGIERYSHCRYYVRDYKQVVEDLSKDPAVSPVAPPGDTPTATCTSWHYDKSLYTSTIVSEWDLVCEDRWLMSSAQASYMLGFMLGALILSELADKFGRRTILLWSTVFFAITTISTVFSVSYLMFITLRCFIAAFGSGIFLSNFVILMESLGVQSRTKFGIMYHLFFSTGLCLLAAIGYYLRNWRDLQLAISVPTLILIIHFFEVPESPRWLTMNGRQEEALVILRRMAKLNKGSLPPKHKLNVYLQIIEDERKEEEAHTSSLRNKLFTFMQSQMTLVGTPNMRRRCLITFFAWFVISMIYYGLAFNGNNLNITPYTLMAISGLVELAANPCTIWILNRCGRRVTLCMLLVVCGIACLIIVFVPVELSMVNLVLSCIGRFFISPAFNVVFMYTAELVPTHVRNIAVGTSSMCARIGSGVAPYIVDLLGAVHYAVPSTVFGGLAVTSGLLALLLPETGNQRMPESIREIEAMPR